MLIHMPNYLQAAHEGTGNETDQILALIRYISKPPCVIYIRGFKISRRWILTLMSSEMWRRVVWCLSVKLHGIAFQNNVIAMYVRRLHLRCYAYGVVDVYCRFGGTYCCHLQGLWRSQANLIASLLTWFTYEIRLGLPNLLSDGYQGLFPWD
jgi:hypothetical protein